jgi:hypothetical protein
MGLERREGTLKTRAEAPFSSLRTFPLAVSRVQVIT